MSAYLKQTDYVNAYDLARDKKVIEGQAKLSDLPRLKDMILPTEGTVTYRICGMTAKKGMARRRHGTRDRCSFGLQSLHETDGFQD